DVSQLPVMDGTTCLGAVNETTLTAKGLENTRLLDWTVSDVMDAPLPTADLREPVDQVAKVLSRENPAVLVQDNGRLAGIVTRSDLLQFLMAR
ncbi:MAG: CBS domain-containing protein, partial [Gemmatimonadetes bacterium]|nr:CBS domain-containing protein [Gemmatimonadota bacterium]